jgi:predicted DNA-binding protein
MAKNALPDTAQKPEPVVLSIRIPKEMMDRLKRLAQKDDRKFTSYARHLIKRGLDEDEAKQKP